ERRVRNDPAAGRIEARFLPHAGAEDDGGGVFDLLFECRGNRHARVGRGAGQEERRSEGEQTVIWSHVAPGKSNRYATSFQAATDELANDSHRFRRHVVAHGELVVFGLDAVLFESAYHEFAM